MRLAAPALLLLLAATAPALPNGARLEQRQRAQAEATDEIILYRTKPGDTLQALAGKWFERPEDWRRAQALNKLKDPAAIPAGTILRLRSVWLKTTPITAELAAFRGDVHVVRRQAGQPVVKGMELIEGDIIETGPNGYATLTLPDRSQVSLPSASRIRLARLRQVPMSDSIDRCFTLEQGRSEAKVTPMANPASRFLITTPVAVAAVRGTRFQVAYTPDELKAATAVTEGKVAVTRLRGIEEVLVRANFGNITTSTGSSKAVPLLPAPAMDTPERLQDAKLVSFQLKPVQGAVRYLVEIATDADFIDRVAGKEIEGTVAAFDGVPNGDYFVRAIAIDANGLPGAATEYAFRRSFVDPSASAKDARKQKAEEIGRLGADLQPEFSWFEGESGDLLLAVSDGGAGDDLGGTPIVVSQDSLPLQGDMISTDLPGGGGGGGGGGGHGGGGGGHGGGGSSGSGGGGVSPPDEPGGNSGGTPGTETPQPPIPGLPTDGPEVIPTDPGQPPAVPGDDDGSNPIGGGGGGGGGGGVTPPVSGGGIIPEPAVWAMLISGFGLVGVALRRRRAAYRA